MTDGLENASREYSYKQIKNMIELQKKCGWDFIFQAANIDVQYEASRLGVNDDMTFEFVANSNGIKKQARMTCMKVSEIRKKPKKK